jgi:hypothetical protein
MPGQVRGREPDQKWIFASNSTGEWLWLSQIGDVAVANVIDLNNAFESHPIPTSIILASNIKTELGRAALRFNWIYNYIRHGQPSLSPDTAIALVVYMRLASWFAYLMAFPDSQVTLQTDSNGQQWYVFEGVTRPPDLETLVSDLSAVLQNPAPNCIRTPQVLWDGFNRFFPTEGASDIPISCLFAEDYKSRLEEFFSAYKAILTLDEVEIIRVNVSRTGGWDKAQVHAYLMSRFPQRTVAPWQPAQAALARHPAPPPPAASVRQPPASAKPVGQPVQVAPAQQPSPRPQPAVSEVDPCDAIAKLFQISGPTAIIANEDSLFGLTREQMTDELRRGVGSQWGEATIAAVVEGIWERNWTLKNIKEFLDQRALLLGNIAALFALGGDDELIAVDAETENPESALTDMLNILLEDMGIDASENAPHAIVQKIINEGMTGLDLCEHLVEFIRPQPQQPANPAPSVLPSKSPPPPAVPPASPPQVAAPSGSAPVQVIGVDAILRANGYVQIHARPDNNCLFNALAEVLAVRGIQLFNVPPEANNALDIARELLFTGTTTRAQAVVRLAVMLEATLGCRVVDETLVRRAAAAPAELQRKLGFDPDMLAAYLLGLGTTGVALIGDNTKERLAKLLLEQLQFIIQMFLREQLANAILPDPLPEALMRTFTAVQADIMQDNIDRRHQGLSQRPAADDFGQYRANYTRKIGQWGEIPDVILMAIVFNRPVYIINQGVVGVVAFDGNGNEIPNPDLARIRAGAIILWNNGTNARNGTHWDPILPGSEAANVNPMWVATP